MGRAKIPRKSTNIDMTAMCDVAFLLLSFFILATKPKPPEAVAVQAPTSVSSRKAPEKSILITLTKEGKVFLMMGDGTEKTKILADLNATRSLGLNQAELNKLANQAYIGVPLGQLKGMLDMSQPLPAEQMSGIPIQDSTNNEMVDWIRSITNAYSGRPQKELEDILLVKGDNNAKYPFFKSIKYALKKNNLNRFRIVTNSEVTPLGSELYNNNKAGVDANGDKLSN
jgi:biopolymer transport protein ExbD